MGYNIDLNKISILKYMEILKSQNPLPGRRILLENIEENFRKITDTGIHSLAELKNSISSKQKLSIFPQKTNIDENYLTILKREIGSLEQKPIPVSDFPGISAGTLSALENQGIKTSKDVYNLSINPGNISSVSRKTGIKTSELLEINIMSNLVRINGIGTAAAKAIYESGYKSIDDIAHAKAAKLLEKMNTANANKQYYKANLGEKDMQFIIDAAKIILDTDI
ncbi:MAG TPA: hypothetical protein DEQ14_12010 [Treponema sp.]|nr:hypothetical protein [Treponema sp.]